VGSEIIPTITTEVSIFGYYSGYPWFSSNLVSLGFVSYYMILYYEKSIL
jgi:hypothetical protein